MNNHFMGMDGFVWFFAKVVDRNDLSQLGRVKIRVYGIHPEDQNLVPDADLPWAIPIQPITSAGAFGVGRSATGLLPGSTVFGFFADGKSCQIPFILGTVATGLGHIAMHAVTQVEDTIKKVREIVAPVESLSQVATGSYPVKSAFIGKRLMEDFQLQDYQAAGILGNLALESTGLQPDVREGNTKGPCWPRNTIGKGYGWAQWTGSRMNEFIDHVKANFDNFDITLHAATDDHNYSFLKHELKNTSEKSVIPVLRNAPNVHDATVIFMQKFERPKASAAQSSLASRLNNAAQALNSMNGVGQLSRSAAKNIINRGP